MRLFEKIVKMKQPQLKRWLKNRYTGKNFDIIDAKGYLLIIPKENPAPILLTAHMDTVHEKQVRQIIVEKHVGKTIVSSPQGIGGDDRCGIYMITRILDDGMRPYVLFCEDEEIGCVGAGRFAIGKDKELITDKVKFIVELDRRNATDAVFYDCDNPDFTEYIEKTTGYKKADGSYSDICEIAPEVKAAAVNLSCGYYHEHTLQHYVVWEEMINTLKVTKKLIKSAKKETTPKYEYIESKYSRWFMDDWYSNYDNYGYKYSGGYGVKSHINEEVYCEIAWMDPESKKMEYDSIVGRSYEECIGMFLMEHWNLSYKDIEITEY